MSNDQQLLLVGCWLLVVGCWLRDVLYFVLRWLLLAYGVSLCVSRLFV